MVGTSRSSDSMDLAEERVGRRKASMVDRRMIEGTGCFFREELDFNFL